MKMPISVQWKTWMVRLVLTIAVGIALTGSSGGALAAIDPRFDPEMQVQLDFDGLDIAWVSADEEDGFVEWSLNNTNFDPTRGEPWTDASTGRRTS